ncbi:TPA: glycosyltransferase family 2 protein [Vibrio vulnificus]|nr:glycosyltransferase family 2 protein [Vibrio vulnificus]
MNVYIAIVSHNHSGLIKDIGCVSQLAKKFNVIIKSNTQNDDFSSLVKMPNFHWLNDGYNKGFGENNNYIFDYCKKSLKAKKDDIFVVLNPDVIISNDSLYSLVRIMTDEKVEFSAVNLFRDHELTIPDNSIRCFPKLNDFIKSFVFGVNNTIVDKSKITEPTNVDWAAGSFLCFKFEHYDNIDGFDDSYFMYCEDIDICFRSLVFGVPLKYYPTIKAVHLAQHKNRKAFSKHFIWHVKSAIRFLMKKRKMKIGN